MAHQRLEYFGGVEAGKLPSYTSTQIRDALPLFNGKTVQITIEERKKHRTSKQNRFYYGPMIQAVRLWLLDRGYVFSAADVHEYLWRNVLKETEIVVMPDGSTFERRLSSKDSTTKDWEMRMDIIRAWAAERDLQLPFPGEGL
jgi:hypothetical protein